MKLSPNEAEFCRLAHNHNIIPVTAEIPADLETPVSVYYKIVGDCPGFILESAETSRSFGRYSFIGAEPFQTVTLKKRHADITAGRDRGRAEGPPLTVMQQLLDGYSCPALSGLPPFAGGAVGYLSYDAAATFERVRGLTVPADVVLGEYLFCRLVVVMDHLTHSAKLIYLARVADPAAAAEAYSEAVAGLEDLAAKLGRPVDLPRDDAAFSSGGTPPGGDRGDDESERRFLAAVARAKEYIVAGDIFQVVLSRPFRRRAAAPPFALYRRLRRVNPSPYMFFLNFGRRQLIGASPEMLVKLQDGQVFTCPIAGTRPRGRDAGEDARLAAELLADEKERAEHAMLVDLGRNDLGRVSRPGTVAVSRFMEVENFSHVMHIVSEVTGRLDPIKRPADVLAACFPAGTVSGAPKVRAMEIVAELESSRRGPYAGAVGYFDFRGNMDTCITIRTMVAEGGQVTVQAGAGIVDDSVPEKEYREILQKAQALFQVIGGDGQ